jgi:glycosyltransferase involved in cell wall biosynthesis
MDAAVAPYPAQRGFYFSPLKVFEYMAAGLPVVASRVGQLAEVIEDGVTGLLCPPGDAVACAEALGRLRAEPALAARLGLAAREHVRRRHSWRAVAGQILRLAGALSSSPLPRSGGEGSKSATPLLASEGVGSVRASLAVSRGSQEGLT